MWTERDIGDRGRRGDRSEAREAVPGRGEALFALALFPVRPALPGDPAPRAGLRGIDDADEDGQDDQCNEADGQNRDHGDHPRPSNRLPVDDVVFIRVPLAVVSCAGWLPGGRGARAVPGGGTDRGGPDRGRGSDVADGGVQVTGIHDCLLSGGGTEGEVRPPQGSPTQSAYAIAFR